MNKKCQQGQDEKGIYITFLVHFVYISSSQKKTKQSETTGEENAVEENYESDEYESEIQHDFNNMCSF